MTQDNQLYQYRRTILINNKNLNLEDKNPCTQIARPDPDNIKKEKKYGLEEMSARAKEKKEAVNQKSHGSTGNFIGFFVCQRLNNAHADESALSQK